MWHDGFEEFGRLKQDARRKELTGKGGSDEFDRLNKSFSWILIAIAFAATFFCLTLKVARGDETGSAKSLVRIQQSSPPDRKGTTHNYYASGVCIDPEGIVLTNHHTTEEPFPVQVKFQDLPNLEGKILYQDRAADVAVLKVESNQPLPYRPIASRKPEVGEEIWFEGFPGMKYQCLGGRVKKYSTMNAAYDEENPPGSRVRVIRPEYEFLHTDYRIEQGGSGGPIIDSDGAVVGIVHGVWADPKLPREETICCSLTSLNQSIEKCGIKKAGRKAGKSLPKAYCLWDKNCAPCHEFILDYGGKNPGKHPPRSPELRQFVDSICRLHFVKVHNAKKLCKKYGVTATPAFLISCFDRPMVGYLGPMDFMQKVQGVASGAKLTTATEFEIGPDSLVQCQADAWFSDDPDYLATDTETEFFSDGTLAEAQPERRGIFPNPFRRQVEVKTPSQTPPQPPQRPAPRPAPAPPELKGHEMEPESESEPVPGQNGDLSEVTAVVLIKKSVPGIAGKVVGYVEEHATGKLTDAINSALSNKATVRIIFERSNPEKYAAVLEAAGLTGESLGEIILVAPKKFDGLAGTLVSKVEAALEGLKHSALKSLPVSAVFERTEEDSYQEVVTALGGTEPSVAAHDEGIFSGGLLSKLGAMLGLQSAGGLGFLLFLWRKIHRTEAKADVAVKVLKEV